MAISDEKIKQLRVQYPCVVCNGKGQYGKADCVYCTASGVEWRAAYVAKTKQLTRSLAIADGLKKKIENQQSCNDTIQPVILYCRPDQLAAAKKILQSNYK